MLENLRLDDRGRIEEMLARGKWALPGEHPIARLDGLPLGDLRLVALLGPRNAVGSRWFQLLAVDDDGRIADGVFAMGLHGAGPYPAYNWVELTQFKETIDVGGRSVDLWASGLEIELFQAVSELVPAGGHIMAEYDSPTHRATERILTLRYPQATTPIGYSMFEAGVRSYRDWYISEGGREGPRKLQGFKPLNDEIAREKTAALQAEVEAMLARPDDPAHGDWGRLARELGRKVLDTLL